MTDELDFSELSDDQVIELAVALAREAMSRNPALQAAFAQSLLDERERAQAAARGRGRMKLAETARIEQQAAQAAAEVARERERKRVQNALGQYLLAASAIISKPPAQLTMVWKRSDFGRGDGPRLQLNQGVTGIDASWHLADYVEQQQRLYTSPALHRLQAELLPWCRETCAAIRALGVDRTAIIRGIEL